jgi:hypothetical protein
MKYKKLIKIPEKKRVVRRNTFFARMDKKKYVDK